MRKTTYWIVAVCNSHEQASLSAGTIANNDQLATDLRHLRGCVNEFSNCIATVKSVNVWACERLKMAKMCSEERLLGRSRGHSVEPSADHRYLPRCLLVLSARSVSGPDSVRA